MRHSIKMIFFLFLFTISCVEPYIPSVIVIDHNYLVIDGFLVGNDSTFIKLSRTQVIAEDTASQPEPDASIQIESESGSVYPLQEKNNGLYVAPSFGLDPANQYRLRVITSNAHEYLSDFASMESSPSLDSVTFVEDLEDDDIDFKVFAHDDENNSPYYLWTFDETWQYSAGLTRYFYQDGQMIPRVNAALFYFCWKTVPHNNVYLHSTTALSADVVFDFNLFSIPQTSRKLYYGYSILVKQYSLTKEAFDYWTLTKKNSESLGGLFDPMPSQALSNFRCVHHPDEPVIGHFSASTVQKKRLFFNRSQISGPTSGPYGLTGYEDCDTTLVRVADISAETMDRRHVIEPFFDLVSQEIIGYIVMQEECVDCRFKGGVLTKPAYWR